MAIISCKGSALLGQIHEKQSMNKSRQFFWELAGSKLGNILGVEKTAEQEAVTDFTKSKTLAQQRQYLAIYSVREDLLQVRENRVVVVGETSSEKTTQFTQVFLMHYIFSFLFILQKIFSINMGVAKRVSEEMETELGDKVGYAIRFEEYMTDGMLLRETLKGSDLDEYRSLSTYVLFRIFKKPVAQRRDFKLIVTSATLNAQKFSNFFRRVCKMKVYNHRMGMDALQVFPVSRTAADQCAGRASRTDLATCYMLYTESAYLNEMVPSPVPEIQRTNLGNVVLLLKSLKIDNLPDFDFMDPPPQDNILNSMYQLWVLSALNNVGRLTGVAIPPSTC
ncbi:hypothetical protein JCGZ_10791 [Jatropha curcas]|uniref:RNA helicase n=1 Tax=Jatropha curcas TaxID=180498 RepID=A0A067LR30_JATCU|nr:hypothetical protein JCGZ_10791 [Jatropha curcas]